ncbi:hypothetical protein K438DRAFT_1959106 [Mycena galopus ATCC 62051]|nr:hypothetical protein K438DRAFT_1959106 [Mycena galopus ATCC 62051]
MFPQMHIDIVLEVSGHLPLDFFHLSTTLLPSTGACVLVQLVGLDLRTTTADHMDTLDPRFVCDDCSPKANETSGGGVSEFIFLHSGDWSTSPHLIPDAPSQIAAKEG